MVTNQSTLRKTFTICSEYYPEKKLKHAVRVANYAYDIWDNNAMAQDSTITPTDAYIVGLLHDIVEDTKCTFSDLDGLFSNYIVQAVKILTKDEDESYDEYIDRVIESEDMLAYVVKKADMKDHLSQKDTLTDKLKEKYFPHIAKFI